MKIIIKTYLLVDINTLEIIYIFYLIFEKSF